MIAQPGVNDDPELELLDFMLKIDYPGKNSGETVLENAEVEIKDSYGKVIYNEDLANPKPRPFHAAQGKAPDYLTTGEHRWQWDGYDNNDILDTANLKKGPLTIMLKVTCNGSIKTADEKISCKAKVEPFG